MDYGHGLTVHKTQGSEADDVVLLEPAGVRPPAAALHRNYVRPADARGDRQGISEFDLHVIRMTVGRGAQSSMDLLDEEMMAALAAVYEPLEELPRIMRDRGVPGELPSRVPSRAGDRRRVDPRFE